MRKPREEEIQITLGDCLNVFIHEGNGITIDVYYDFDHIKYLGLTLAQSKALEATLHKMNAYLEHKQKEGK